MGDLTPFVDALIDAFHRRGTFQPEHGMPRSVEEAYAVHTALMAVLGPIGGFKISQKADRPAVVAPIPESRCFGDGARVDVPARVGVELEVGFVVTAPVPAPDAPDFRAGLLAAVRPAPMIELVASRLDGPHAEDPVVKLADLQACEALVAGDMLADWDGADFNRPEVTFRYDASEIAAGTGQVPGGSALAALEATARIVAARFGGLQPGQRVITGSLTPLTFIRAGQAMTGEVAGLGGVSARI
ncbi:MAG: hydratase [Pseudomonadota bacterium]